MSGPTTPTNDPLMDGLMGDFLDESSGLLQHLNENLFTLDEFAKVEGAAGGQPDADLLNEMFRAAHSLKGLSGMLRLNNINGLTHKVENIFDAARNGALAVTTDVVELVFQAVDRLEAMIEMLRASEGDNVDCQDVLVGIESLLQRTGTAKQKTSQADAERTMAELMAANSPQVAPTVEIPPALAPARVDPAAAVETDPLSGVVNDEDIIEKYLAIFIDESELTLDEISESLIADGGASSTESLLVCCHRLKGSAASIGLHRIARLAHRLEDLLQDLRRRREGVSQSLADAMLKCVDAVRNSVAGLRMGDRSDTLGAALRLLPEVTAESTPGTLPPNPTAGALQDREAHLNRALAAAPEDAVGFVCQVAFRSDLELVELKARVLLERLHQLGRVYHCHPSEDELDASIIAGCLTIGVLTDAGQDDVKSNVWVQGVANADVVSIADRRALSVTPFAVMPATRDSTASGRAVSPADVHQPPTAGDSVNASASKAGKSKPTETLRVDIERLDQLMNLAGQLVINRARFSEIGAKLKGASTIKSALNSVAAAHANATLLRAGVQDCLDAKSKSAVESMSGLAEKICSDLEALQTELSQLTHVRSGLNDLSEAIHQLGRVSDGIQSTVMETRMVPIGPLFTRFKRVVRDLSRSNNKQIDLVIHGEGTELDKRMIDELGDPLIHLVRNSADHGIESPEQRIAAGKSPEGTITLNAFHRGNRIVIQIVDDGKGLDADRIRAKALSKGVISEVEAERMTLQQIYQLIWQPGLSTAEQVTEVSGRGMGMDIVLSKIEQINGAVELTSTPGLGTMFEITLPLTMAILPSLLTVIDSDVFAIPVESVIEIVQVPEGALPTIHGRATARIRDRVISVVELDDLFAWSRPAARPTVSRSQTTLVIVGVDGQELGLVVDELLGEQDVVIKSMEENFQNVDGIAGASILGDGRVSLILDASALLAMARRPIPCEPVLGVTRSVAAAASTPSPSDALTGSQSK